MLEALIAEFLPYIIGAVAVIGALFGYGRHQRRGGRKDAEIEQLESTAKAREKANEVDRELSALDDDAIRHRAGDWVRGKDRR